MSAEAIVRECLRDTGADRISDHARAITLIGLIHAPLADVGRQVYRRRIKATFVQGNPNVGSVFLIFVLPILIAVISAWIQKWILNRKDLSKIQGQAYDALTELSPSTTATLTSINTPGKKQGEPSEW